MAFLFADIVFNDSGGNFFDEPCGNVGNGVFGGCAGSYDSNCPSSVGKSCLDEAAVSVGKFLAKFFRKKNKDLVGLEFAIKIETCLLNGFNNALCAAVCVFSHFEIKAGVKSFFEHCADYETFCKHITALFDEPAKVVVNNGIGENKSFAEEKTVFGSTKIKTVGKSAKVFKGYVVAFCGKGGSKSCAVNKEPHSVCVAIFGKGGKFRFGVKGSELGGLGNVNKFGNYHMFAFKTFENGVDDFGGEFSVNADRNSDGFSSHIFNGTGFVNVDVAGVGADYRIIGVAEKSGNCKNVGCGSAGSESNFGVGGSAKFADLVCCRFGMAVHSVRGVGFVSKVKKFFDYLGVCAFRIIVSEAVFINICSAVQSKILL